MPATRILLLLMILGGLVLFALQNWSPLLPLVILGMRTQALPLAFWMLGAIAAGVLTTLVIAALFSLQVATSPVARRSRQAKRSANQAPNPATPNSTATQTASSSNAAWNYGWSGSPEPSAGSSYAAPDYSASEANVRQPEEWEDWSNYQEPSRPPADDLPNIETPAQDAEDQEWSDWQGYDEEDEPRDRTIADAEPPPPTNYEVPQEPMKRSQSGTVYSYSYRRSENTGAGKSEPVYDADYRVIRPPYKPLDESSPPPVSVPPAPAPTPPPQPANQTNEETDEEDWDWDDWDDRPRRDDDEW